MKSRLVVVLLLAAAGAVWGAWFFGLRRSEKVLPPDAEGTLRVVFLKVGYGDAAWVRTPGGKHLLVDAGPGPFGKLREMGAQLLFSPDNVRLSLNSYLGAHGVKRLEAVFVSHHHYDHWGGLDALLAEGKIPVAAVYETGAAEADAAYQKFRERLAARGVRLAPLSAGARVDVGDPALAVDVLGPRRSYRESRNPVQDASLVLKLSHGEVSFLFPGDAAPEAEFDLLESGEALEADVLKVSNHGGQQATTPPFLDWVRPSAAVVSVETPNPFGNPHDETLQRFVDRDIPYYRTDLDGHVLVVSDGKVWTVHTRWND